MYNEELEPVVEEIENLFLDPNNPRFWDESESKRVPDVKIPDSKEQERTFDRIQKFGVEELYFSILRNGFLPLDRIVVRPIQGHGGKFVVVEGNRRLAALKLLHRRIDEGMIKEEGIDEKYLESLKASTEKLEVLLYKGSEIGDIAWILQGIRHISGVKDWQPAQRARLVAEQIDGAGMKFTEAAQKFGLTARAVGRLYRAYRGLEQMRQDDEFGAKAKNEYFSLFEEVHRNPKVREWLGWKDEQLKFSNEVAVKQFYAWIVPDDEAGGKRRVHDPKHVAIISELLEKKREDLLGQIDRYEVTIEEAKGRIAETPGTYDWKAELERAQKAVSGIPMKVILEEAEALRAELLRLRELTEAVLGKLK